MLPGPSLSPAERERSFAGEPHGPAPPLAVASSDQAPIHRSVASGGLPMLRRALLTRVLADLTPEMPVLAKSGEFPSRAAAGIGSPASSTAACAREPREPTDPE